MELRETHISQVFLSEDLVYKVKRPVNLGFLDFTTLASRKAACDAEVALNERLAPDVYLGVVPITRDAVGAHVLEGAGEPVEWAVKMRRLPLSDCAEERLSAGRLERGDVERIAERIASFHEIALCNDDTARHGSPDAIEANVRENFEQTRETAALHLGEPELRELERWQLDFLRRESARFLDRVARRRVRDGHGDLRLEHCYLDAGGQVRIIDCIEFNERFRFADVCADLAFLSMDLSWHERHDLSEALLAAYARHSGDYDLYGVVDFYESYRAHVRAKVSSFLEQDAGVDPELRKHAAAQARKYYLLAAACAREPLQRPVLYAVGGTIASGKSTLSRALAARIDAVVIDADRTRKQLAGVAATTPLGDAAFQGHYTPESSARVYAELLRRAEVVLSSGRPVVLDASFRAAEQRLAALELSRRAKVPFAFVECTAPPEICRRRLVERAQAPSVSDGRAEVFDRFTASFEPVVELPPEVLVRADTTQPIEALAAGLVERLP
jgi:aminoglycoside phosphotransferase family enzyme/predicted kinase